MREPSVYRYTLLLCQQQENCVDGVKLFKTAQRHGKACKVVQGKQTNNLPLATQNKTAIPWQEQPQSHEKNKRLHGQGSARASTEVQE